jgi:hypothetical protein
MYAKGSARKPLGGNPSKPRRFPIPIGDLNCGLGFGLIYGRSRVIIQSFGFPGNRTGRRERPLGALGDSVEVGGSVVAASLKGTSARTDDQIAKDFRVTVARVRDWRRRKALINPPGLLDLVAIARLLGGDEYPAAPVLDDSRTVRD